jgi:hypothetical protein
VFPSEDGEAEEDRQFRCPRCGERLTDCRRTRRAPRGNKPRIADATAARGPKELTGEDLEQCAKEWERSQEHLGRLGEMAESMWALDWADRLLREIGRLRDGG